MERRAGGVAGTLEELDLAAHVFDREHGVKVGETPDHPADIARAVHEHDAGVILFVSREPRKIPIHGDNHASLSCGTGEMFLVRGA